MDWLDYRKKLGLEVNDKVKMELVKREILNSLELIEDEEYPIDDYVLFCNKLGVNADVASAYETIEDVTYWLRDYDGLNFIFAIVVFVNNISCVELKNKIFKIVLEAFKNNRVSVEVFYDNEGCFIFPKGAKELDDALVSEPLEWLKDYPAAYKAFVKGLKAYSNITEDNASEVADLLRKALESFFQEFFSSDKSLENLKSEYGTFLSGKGVPGEIKNNFEKLLEAYTKYNNNYAKHHDKTCINVLEYIMYQTGSFIRLLITLKEG